MPHSSGNDLLIGTSVSGAKPVVLTEDARRTHTYVCGSTGSGKSFFLENMIRQDILAWRDTQCGLLVLDYHGNLYDNIVAWLAVLWQQVERPIVLIDLRDGEHVISYNVLRKRSTRTSVLIEDFVQAIAHTWGAADTKDTPRFARWVDNVLTALYEKEFVLADAHHLMNPDASFLRKAMTEQLNNQLAGIDWQVVNEESPLKYSDRLESTINRLRSFLSNDYFRAMFAEPTVSFDPQKAIEDGAIVLVNLATEGGNVSPQNAEMFAKLLLNDFWLAAKERGKKGEGEARPFYVYLDEFQEFITPTMAKCLDQARGFGIHFTLANQFLGQLANSGTIFGQQLYDSVMENAKNKVVFQLSARENQEPLAHWLFQGTFNPRKVKDEIYSTKVLGYDEVIRKSYGFSDSESEMHGSAYGTSQGQSQGTSQVLSDAFSQGEILDVMMQTVGFNQSAVQSRSRSANSQENFSTSYSENEARSMSRAYHETFNVTLVPVFGKELSSRQFESLEEQMFYAMAVLFDQEQRQCVTRLRNWRTPLSLYTPWIEPSGLSGKTVKEYQKRLICNLPYALPWAKAHERLAARDHYFQNQFVIDVAAAKEPEEGSRRIVKR